ncbi:HlyD family efflux transporter periplasmic adaptor subunit [Paracoccus sp. PS-1]|uniref:HlyD family secretion protein n=1 Tax=unclassified Paracoccus (in: a-proteobacteria) TaxID=2688777 RepID=UPI00048CBC2B|nr:MULTISPECIES: HlyD family efflux transporter periplasmic adaptor subunit [unclassified Paracoccus (in: a-proteobacteria)]MDQ7262120.1 HlyD family efflux transporter periplasmic adaptor subunit [Paracoccus sp. PS1]RQP05962.1 MAG: HlyD family efflux transporter periplasmic adaptor subunit [Paracoccus sp. BP8]
MAGKARSWWGGAAALAVLAIVGWLAWQNLSRDGQLAGIASGNGRIEATEIDISALSAGRIARIQAAEGQVVRKGDLLVQMDTLQLEAQKRQAEAQLRRARIGVETAQSLVTQAEAQHKAAEAAVEQARAAADAAAARLARTESLARSNVASQQVLDDVRASGRETQAALASAEANLAAAEAGIGTARAQVVDAEAAVDAAQAAIEAVEVQIGDATLQSPRDGRVQYRIAQEGEIVAAGGRILNLVDLEDVYMTFFLPTSQAGRVEVGAEARLVMDAAPQYVIPARISYVADVAQFTPKTVETAEEREKLMFRVRAQIDPELLRKYSNYVKTGLPGTAYVRIDAEVAWPDALSNLVE